MIEKLVIHGNDFGEIPPSPRQIVNKINEIVEWINNHCSFEEYEQD